MHDTLREQQSVLARHLRDPARHPSPPGIEARRMRVYRELFLGSIESLLAGGFPVIRDTLGDADWNALVQMFYARHRSRTPLFTRIAAEFVEFIDTHADDLALPPWLPELAHYEWVEQALLISDAQAPAHDPDGDLLEGRPLLSPLAMPLAYRWPVLEIGPSHIPHEPPPHATTLLVHRDRDHQVRFARIAPLTYHLLTSLQVNAYRGREHLAALAAQTGGDAIEMQIHGLDLLRQLREQGVVVGTHLAMEPGDER